MAKKITTKKPLSGNLVSHSQRKNKRKQNLNLQTVTIDGEKVRTTAREAKTFRKNTAKAA